MRKEKLWMLGMMASIMSGDMSRTSVREVNAIKNHNKRKQCAQCGNTHQKHSKFCSDDCARKYIEEKRGKDENI